MPQTIERTQVGKRESLADTITIVDAKKTPFFASVSKGSDPANSLFSWQVDAYDAPIAGAVVDGTDVSTTEDAAASRALLSNYTEEFRRTPKVTNRADLSNVAGIGQKKEFAKAIVKKQFEIKRDIDAACCSDNDAQADNGTVGYKTRALGSTIKATAGTVLPIDSDYLTPSASIDTTALASLTPDLVNTVMQSMYGETGDDGTFMLLCGPSLKKRFTKMVGYQPDVASNTAIKRTSRGDAGKWQDNIHVWEGDFGTLELVMSNFLGWNFGTGAKDNRRGYVLDMNLIELRYQQPIKFDTLPNLGGGPRGLISTILGLCVKNPKGMAKFAASADS